jgi:outer membrane receptor protein involved in Fe transport
MGGGGARPGQGLMQFSIYHTWRLQDEIKIRDGLPVLDLLDGSAVNKRGGQPRHEVQMQAGYFKNGAGVRLNGNWKAKTWVDGGVSGQDLFFSDLATLNLSLFADLTTARRDWVKTYPLLNRTRVSFNVDNLFNQKQDVHDALGVTPQAYQADYMDSLGRTVRFSVRKVWG